MGTVAGFGGVTPLERCNETVLLLRVSTPQPPPSEMGGGLICFKGKVPVSVGDGGGEL